jgi:N-acetylglucosaminyl-diphospho-decaprenol L-rhamnosyltransferase
VSTLGGGVSVSSAEFGAEPRRGRRLPDLLVLGQEHWDQVERRNQLLIRALAQRNPDGRVLFAERPHRLRDLRSWRRPVPRRVTANIWVLPTVRPFTDRVSRRLGDHTEALQIRRAAHAVGLERPYIWTQDPRAVDLVDLLQHSGVIFDMTDDWAAFEDDIGARQLTERRTARLVREADLVLACSEPLADLARRLGAEPVDLPNAVDAPVKAPVPAGRVAALKPPRLGYVGTLHSARLDVELLARAAETRPDWSFPLIGPNLLEPADAERLFTLANVHYLGPCAHAEVPRYLAGLEVALMPHRVNPFTASLDPLKTYEYLAAGLPVIATAAGVPETLAGAINVIATPDELVASAERLLTDDSPALARQRQTLVAGATWESRAATVEAELGVAPELPRPGLVSVVIVSFNTRDLLAQTLAAVAADSYGHVETIVVDNGSTDGSQAMVAEFGDDVELIELERNLGFAAANNLGLGRARGEFVLILNSDAFLSPGTLAELVAAARRHPEAGAIGPRLLNEDGSLQRSAWAFPASWRLLPEAFALHRLARLTRWYEDLGTWDHADERTVDFLVGACLLLRRTALVQTGGFDERFWMYAEEADLQRRMLIRGWTTVLAPGAEVVHVGSASAVDDRTRLELFYRGQFRFLAKHGGTGAALLGRVALLIGALLRRRWVAARIALSAGAGR